MASSKYVLVLAVSIAASAVGLPQASVGHTLAVSGEAQPSEIAITGSGQQIVSNTRGAPHVRREAIHESGTLLQMGKPEGKNLTGHPPTLSAKDAADRLEEDGIVDTFNAVTDASQEVKLEEETMECMMDTPVWECMEKHGSYGVRRLYTDKVGDYNTLENWRKDWMAHPTVQTKKLFDITWPGSHESGAYGLDEAILDTDEAGKTSVKGAITQHLDVYSQLDVGVRAIEAQVAVSKKDGQLYTANGFLTMSLATVLTDIASFLETQHHEVVLLYMKKADVYHGIEAAHVQPLKDEEKNPEKIPGESVHKGVQAVIGKHLATYKALSTLPAKESPENPGIGAAVAAGIRVFYFWEGQQVLCITKEECAKTPGWQRGTLGQPLAFGPGLPYGARTNLAHGTGSQTYMEPGCIHRSGIATQSSNPIQLLLNIKKYAGALMNSAKTHPTTCFPTDAAVPALHTPTLLYEVDVWASPFTEAEGAYRTVYKDISEIYTRGESATLKSEAERVNYLTLNWLLRKNWAPLFMKLSIISMDYVAPITVHRIVEANQDRKDCGYAIYCKVTASCWAQTLLDSEANACKEEPQVLAFLKWHADGHPWPFWIWILLLVVCGVCLKCCITGSVCFMCGNTCCPSCCFEGGGGIVWWKRKKKEVPVAEPEISPEEIIALALDAAEEVDDHLETAPEQQDLTVEESESAAASAARMP